MLLVHLAAGPTPQIEALAIVAADGALARVSPDHVVHVDQLPSFLVDILAHGDVIAAGGDGGSDSGAVGDPSATATAPAPSGGASTLSAASTSTDHTAPAADGGQSLGHTAHAATLTMDQAPASGASGAGVGPAPPATTPGDGTATLPTPATPATPPPAHDAAIDAAVITFVTDVANVQVLVSGHDVVFYDPAIMGVLQPGVALDSVTWRLEDGSTVSLVGTVPELHAAHGVG
jgi:hypothetical protein